MANIQHSSLTDSDGLHEPKGVATATSGDVYVADGAGSGSWDPLEGTEVYSTGETGGIKYLREDGDNTCSWQAAVAEGTAILSTGETGNVKFLGEDGDNTSSWTQIEGATHIGSTGPVTAGYSLQADGAAGAGWIADNIYGGIGLYDGSVAVSSIGVTAQKLTVFNVDMPSVGVTADSTTDDDLTVTVAGDYVVHFHASFATVAAGDAGTYEFHLRVNGSEGSTHQKLGLRRDMSGSSDVGAGGFGGITHFAANDVLTIWVESDDVGDNDDLTFHECFFSVELVGAD
jgi:hypothetical protein